MRKAALLLVGLTASSCTASGPSPQMSAAAPEGTRTAMTSPPEAVVEVATYRSSGITASGRLEGTLAIVDGCIMLATPTSADGVLVFFPEGEVRWNREDQSLNIGAERFRLGDKIFLTGGASSISNYAGRVNVPRQCARTGGFFAGAKAIILK